ncbi:MAG: hypothetical protein A3H97_02565 [Acidobacteria bacterium RIFCSPLOWO2_02_FULL_65_29]|nr:MAG: hypothetical protein A3H97_02565 [Acidobacteria bacterium RIFCSPLOWO2_02_FULL_65_29]
MYEYAATEIYVIHGETAAVATYARRAIKEMDSGRPLEPLAQKMHEMAKKYYDTSRPAYCARYGFVDEIVAMKSLRGYLTAFAGAAYQNPSSICPRHLMMLPRSSKADDLQECRFGATRTARDAFEGPLLPRSSRH